MMPDLDTSRITSGILDDQGSPKTVQSSKRPRDDGSPLRGKRGRGENGSISIARDTSFAYVTSAAPDNGSGGVDYEPAPSPPPLCESPSKINQTSSSFAPFSGGAAAPKPGVVAAPAAVASAAANAAAATAAVATTASCGAVTRRKGRVLPRVAPPSLGATDPIFHAALLRLLHGRNGEHCAEAVGWRWKGDTPARFDHWPCALHPVVMDLLACVSAGEEQVVMSGCDKKQTVGVVGKNRCGTDVHPPPTREAAWRVPRPRTPSAHRGVLAATPEGKLALPATPAGAKTPTPVSSQTPLSALRRPGSTCRLSSKNRVRFSTHDMSVVDTPDPQRGGSEEGMISALDGLESILSAAERVRELAAAAPRQRGGGQQYEGYFDRFSAAGGDCIDGGYRDGTAVGDEQESVVSKPGVIGETPGADSVGTTTAAADDSGGGVHEVDEHDGSAKAAVAVVRDKEDDDEDDEDYLTREAKSVRRDSAAFVAVLEEIASSDSAPGEIALTGGWGPEHSNAAAFYAKELALLCGTKAHIQADVAPQGRAVACTGVGSHLRVRYLDVLSCLVRYNLKLLLNVCDCQPQEENAMEEEDYDEQGCEELEHGEADAGDDSDGAVSDEGEKAGSNPTSDLPPSPASTAAASASAALTVIVPGRAALLREQGLLDAAWGSSVTVQPEKGVCSCVSVLDDKGALEFNTEDVAALLTLALGRVYPFMTLAARITAAAEEAGWDGGACEDEDGSETLDARVWAAVQQYTLEGRCGSVGAPPPNHLFSSPVSSPAMQPPPCADTSCKSERTNTLVGDSGASPNADCKEGGEREEGEDAPALAVAGTMVAPPSGAAPGSPTAADSLSKDVLTEAVAGVELTVDEAADLLEFVAAARFIAQLMAEPVVAAGVSAGRWSCAMRLAEQVQKLAEEEQRAYRVDSGASNAVSSRLSLSNMLCLGALADVQALGSTMAQQARYAPALETALKRELRQALRGGQGAKRRIRNRLPLGAPEVFAFPMIMPACQLVTHG